MLTKLLPHAYVIELVQLVISILGAGLLWWGRMDACRDAKVFYESGSRDPAQEVIAKGNVYRAHGRLAMAMLFTVGGVFSVTLPPPPPIPAGEYELPMTAARLVLIGATVILLLDGANDRVSRQLFFKEKRRAKR